MVFAPASALHSAANVSVARNLKKQKNTAGPHPPRLLHFVRHLRGQPGLILLLWPRANAPAKHQGLTAVWWCLRHACFYSRKIL